MEQFDLIHLSSPIITIPTGSGFLCAITLRYPRDGSNAPQFGSKYHLDAIEPSNTEFMSDSLIKSQHNVLLKKRRRPENIKNMLVLEEHPIWEISPLNAVAS
jgi:hypothetical protein